MKTGIRIASLILAASWAGFVQGGLPTTDASVLPPANELVEGPSSTTIVLGEGQGGRLLAIFGPNLLSAVPVGSVLTSFWMRQDNAAQVGWPPVARTIADYEIYCARAAVSPASISNSFSANVIGRVQVRDGPLTLRAQEYSGFASIHSSQPEHWGVLISFTRGYVYTGGALVIEFSSSGTGDLNGRSDALTIGADSAAITSTSRTSLTGTSAAAPIVLLYFEKPVSDLARGVTKIIVDETMAGGTGPSGTSVLSQSSARTYVTVAGASQFDTIGPGSDIVGMTTRLSMNEAAAWPLAPASFASYDVQLSRSVNGPGALSTTIANNVGADAATVRTGSFTVPVGGFGIKGTQPNAPFGVDVEFLPRYQYRDGALLTVIRHGGQTSGSTAFFDSLAPGLPGYGTRFQALSATSINATTAAETNFTTTRFSVDAGTSSPLNAPMPLPGNAGVTLTPLYQTILSASELKYIPVGSVIDSLWLRQARTAGAGPSFDVTAWDFEVTLSSAAQQPIGMSAKPELNEGLDKVLVHDGVLGVLASALPAGSNGNFGKLVQFKKHFVYKGGPLCVTIRHTGLSGALGEPEAVMGTMATNRSIYSFTPGSDTGQFLISGYTGTAMKLGYIPSVMAPNALATVDGNAESELPRQASYTAQVIISADQLRTIDVGSAITGMSLRHADTGNSMFPSEDRTLSRFDVTMCRAARTPLSASNTFTTNMSSGAVAVRSGPLVVPKAAFVYQSGSGPCDNEWYVQFSRAYVYTGGDLCITMRDVGALGEPFLTNYFDVDGTVASARGVTKYTTGDANATTAASTSGGLAIRLAFTVRAFCPWDLDNDGDVDFDDLVIFAPAYNTKFCTNASMPMGCPADFNYDRVVDDADFDAFIAATDVGVCP